jgi:hypothetical protein
MTERKTLFKWWWGWSVERLERWLEAKEAEGWNLERAGGMGVFFTFRRGEPRRVAYRVDYQTRAEADYTQLFEDTGWSLAGRGAGWYYWRQEYADAKPEIYTDVESLIGRNRRQMTLLAVLLAVQAPAMNTVMLRAQTPFISVVAALQLTMIALLAFAVLRFMMANRRLRKQGHPAPRS